MRHEVVRACQLWCESSSLDGPGREVAATHYFVDQPLEMSSLTSPVVILCWKSPGDSENHARKIAEFLGAEVSVVPMDAVHDVESMRRILPRCAALIVHIDTLVQMSGALDFRANGVLALVDLAARVFVYGFESKDAHVSILRALSLGGLTGIATVPMTDARFCVSNRHRECCGPFSGLSIGTVDPKRDACFVNGEPHPRQSVLVRAPNEPFFVRVDHEKSQVFLVACRELARLDEAVYPERRLLSWFSRLVPLMMFLKASLGGRLWHNDTPQACFIIDDPLLKPRYGFLRYARLLDTMSRQRFSTSIAFIPWNYRRSRRQIARLLAETRGFFSLSIHGCDHTGAEFAAADFELLRGKARLALERMQRHNQLSGVPFDGVMVFPQGLFSCEAIKALGACGYLAAVNTELHPANRPQALMLRDLLDVAVTAFDNFPLFGRHYPTDLSAFAFDLFLGKPTLVVEHHGYFRNGYRPLENFVQQLNALDERLEWSSLATVCSRACLKRVTAQGDIDVRFYTNQFRLANSAAGPQTYSLFRKQTAEKPLPDVTVNGYPWARTQEDDDLKVVLSLQPGEAADIRILAQSAAATVPWRPTVAHRSRVLARRLLCEFRDNHLETNRLFRRLLSQARRLRNRKRRLRSRTADVHTLRAAIESAWAAPRD